MLYQNEISFKMLDLAHTLIVCTFQFTEEDILETNDPGLMG